MVNTQNDPVLTTKSIWIIQLADFGAYGPMSKSDFSSWAFFKSWCEPCERALHLWLLSCSLKKFFLLEFVV